jgi:hypothetical protein
MKETQSQVLESTSQWPQKILALAPSLNRPLVKLEQPQFSRYRQTTTAFLAWAPGMN